METLSTLLTLCEGNPPVTVSVMDNTKKANNSKIIFIIHLQKIIKGQIVYVKHLKHSFEIFYQVEYCQTAFNIPWR